MDLLVIHRAAHGCWRAADVQNQLGDAFDVLHSELRVDAPLKSVPRIGGEVVTPRPTRHRLGPPKRGLHINVLRVIRHRGGVSTHDPRQRLYLRVIGNDADLLIQCHGVAVQQFELLARAGPTHLQGAMNFVQVKNMGWPPQLKHDVVGNIHQGRHRALPAAG